MVVVPPTVLVDVLRVCFVVAVVAGGEVVTGAGVVGAGASDGVGGGVTTLVVGGVKVPKILILISANFDH